MGGFDQHTIAPVAAIVSPEDVREAMDRICASPGFAVSERGRRFLAYIVEEALAGRGDRIKAFAIAVDVFGRDTTFDAHNDPIVRVEAGRIRRALEHYYLAAGASDPIEIRVEKGGYVPRFLVRHVATPARQPSITIDPPRASAGRALTPAAATSPGAPSILICWFDDVSRTDKSRIVAHGLTEAVILSLSRFREVIVVLRGKADGAEQELSSRAAQLATRYELSGSVLMTDDEIHVAVRVSRREDGAVLWANAFDIGYDPLALHDVVRKISDTIATTLAQSHGIIFQAEASMALAEPPDDWEAYQSTLAYYTYENDLTAEQAANVRQELRRTVKRYPNYSAAWALLAMALVDEVRFDFRSPAETATLLQDALDAARQATRIDSQNVRALQAEMIALHFRGERKAAMEVGARALAMNPNDSHLMAEYGLRLAASGDWDRGSELITQALARNPGPHGLRRTVLALGLYIKRDYVAAAACIDKVETPRNPLYHLSRAAIYAQLGNQDEAARSRTWIELNAPQFLPNLPQVVSTRVDRPEDCAHMLEGLALAGFVISH